MDPKLAAMLARKKKAQEEAEDAEWGDPPSPRAKSPPRSRSPPRAKTPPRAKSPPRPADPPRPKAPSPPPSPPKVEQRPPSPPPPAPAPAPPAQQAAARAPSPPQSSSDPFAEFFGSATTPVPAQAPAAPASPPNRPSSPPVSQPAASSLKKQGGDGGQHVDTLYRPPQGDTAIAYKVTAGSDPVPVLVIGGDGKNWREGAQGVSSAYNGLMNLQGGGGKGGEGVETMGPAMASPNRTVKGERIRVVGQATPDLAGGSIWDNSEDPGFKSDGDDELSRKERSHARARAARSLSPKTKDARGAGRSTSVPASARSGLLDNNVLALSTGTTQERAAAARRICSRVKTAVDLQNLVKAGVIGRVAALLSEPLGMDAAVDGLIPLCAYIGGDEPETQDAAADLCAEVEVHSIVERLSAVLCWGNSTDDLKGRIAMLMFYMAKVNLLANRIVRQDGALKSLVQLLDCADAGANTSAAAALANITYWSTEPIPRYSQLRVVCAL